MGTPHKHAEVIKAWADGATIQCREIAYSTKQWNTFHCNEDAPGWHDDYEYRVKPENVVQYCALVEYKGQVFLDTPWGAKDSVLVDIDPVFAAKGILRIEFNPDTLELVSATMEAP